MRRIFIRFNKPIKYVFVALLILSIGALLYSDKNSPESVEYSSMSPKKNGLKALYMLVEDMNYNITRYQRPSRFLPDDGVLVAIKPQTKRIDDLEKKYLQQWVENGNVFILADTIDVLEKILPDLPYKNTQEVGKDNYIPLGNGTIILLGSPEDYTNEGIREIDAGVNFIKVLDKTGKNRILFNEYYHGLGEENITLWDLIGSNGELIFVQILLSFIVFVFYASRRFGKPVTVFEIIKRKENESMFAMANIYFKAKAYPLVLKTYMGYFNKSLYKYLGVNKYSEKDEITLAINNNRYLKQYETGRLIDICNNYIESERYDQKTLNNLIEKLEVIRKGIK